MTKNIRMVPVVSLLFLFSAGCVRPFVVGCREAATDPNAQWKYAESKADVACSSKEVLAYAYPHAILHDEKKEKWEINFQGVLTSDFKKVQEDQAKSVDFLLSHKDREVADFVDGSKGFRLGLEKEEKILLWMMRRLRYVETYNQFIDLVGELPSEMRPQEFSYFFPTGRKFYSMRVLYPVRNIEAISFTSEYLEAAKRGGMLKLVDSFDITSSQEFAKKVPNLYDPNDFAWETHVRGWKILSYKVVSGGDKPADNIVHYIEIYRKSKDLKDTESRPAVRGFLAAGGQKVSVFIVDYDKEGTPGFGSPDGVVRSFTDITTGNDIFADSLFREKLLVALYDSPQVNPSEKPERKRPKDRTIYTEIVKLGEAKVDLWEKGMWSVPIDYKTLSSNIEIEYKKPENAEERRIQEREKLKRIKLFTRHFMQDGKKVVSEYWIPKDDYTKFNIAEVYAFSTIQLRRKGYAEEKADVEHFGKYRKAIEYFYGGKWFQIVDENGDGVFEKKREIAEPAVNATSIPNLGGYNE